MPQCNVKSCKVTLILLANYVILCSARAGSFLSDFEYPELQLLFKSKEEIKNAKTEEENGSKIWLRPVQDGKPSDKTDVRPWMKFKFTESNEMHPRTKIHSENKQNYIVQNYSNVHNVKEKDEVTSFENKDRAKRKYSSSIGSTEIVKNNDIKLKKERNYETIAASEDISLKADQCSELNKDVVTKYHPSNSKMYIETPHKSVNDMNYGNLNLINDSKGNVGRNNNIALQAHFSPIIPKGSDDSDSLNNETNNYSVNKNIKVRRRTRYWPHLRNVAKIKQNITSNQEFTEAKNTDYAKEVMGSSNQKTTSGDKTLKPSPNTNNSNDIKGNQPQVISRDSEKIDTENISRRKTAFVSEYVRNSGINSKINSDSSNYTSNKDPTHVKLRQLSSKGIEGPTAMFTNLNDAVPMTFPIPEQTHKIGMSSKNSKENSLRSDIVARPPIKLLAQSEKKAGKSLANSIPVPEKSNPLERDIKDKTDIRRLAINSNGIVSMNVKTDIKNNPVEVKVDYTATNIQQTQDDERALKLIDKPIESNNISDSKANVQAALKNSKNSKDRLLDLGKAAACNQQSALVDDSFYSLTNTNAPSAKLTALIYKAKDKRKLIDLLKRRTMSRTKIGIKRSIGDRKTEYDMYEEISTPSNAPLHHNYDYEDYYDIDNKNAKTNHMGDPNEKSDVIKDGQKEDDSEEYYFYVDKFTDQPFYEKIDDNNMKNKLQSPSKLSSDVFAHPLTLDDPELEIVHNEARNKYRNHPPKTVQRPKRRRLKTKGYSYSEQKAEQKNKLINSGRAKKTYLDKENTRDYDLNEKDYFVAKSSISKRNN